MSPKDAQNTENDLVPFMHETSVTPPKQSRKWLLVTLGAVGLVIIIIAILVLRHALSSWSLFPSEPSNNPLNNEKETYAAVLKQAVDETGIGWMKEETINAEGCVIGWKNTESCSYTAFLMYRSESDAKKAIRQMTSKGWASNEDKTDTEESDSFRGLGAYIKTIRGKQVCIDLFVDTENGDAFANINALECENYAKLKQAAYKDWTPYLPKNVPERYTYRHQRTPLYGGIVNLEYRTARDLSDVNLDNPMRIEVEQIKRANDSSPGDSCPAIASADTDRESCKLSFTTPSGRQIYTSKEYDSSSYQYHYVWLDQTMIIIREWVTSDSLLDEELVVFVDSLTPILPQDLRSALPSNNY